MRKRLTKEEFLEVYEKEMKERDLTPLTRDFYKNVLASLFAEKEGKSLKAEIKTLERDTVREMLVEMFLCRVVKVIEIMLNSGEVDLSQLTDEEVEVVEKINEILNKFRRSEEITIKEIIPQNVLVVFVRPHPPFLASNKKIYGPFSEGDVAYLPIVDVTDLKNKGVVTIIKE